MGINELFFWLSANRSGSWGKFRAAAEELVARENARSARAEGLPVHQGVRFSLQQLGHVEFGASGCEGGWRVAPPVLALAEKNGGMAGLLCGARLPKLVATLEESLAEAKFGRIEVPEQPDVIRFFTKNTDLVKKVSEHAQLRMQRHASASLLSCLPRVTDLPAWHTHQSDLPFGKHVTVDRFDLNKATCRWIESSVDEARRANEGLFRFTRYQQREHYMRTGGRTISLQGQLGNYVLAAKRRRRLLRYNRAAQELTVPDVCRPPLLIDRALILCSGFLPRHDPRNRTLTYIDVPEGIAGMSAGILCQEHL